MFRLLLVIFSIFAVLFSGCSKSEIKETEPKVVCTENILRINLGDDVQTLDPRLARDNVSKCVLNMLYDGLVRFDTGKNPQLSLAKDVDITEDGLIYTFMLREAYWSNGLLVTAQDFVSSWKTILDPEFPANCASQLYVLKNARAAKEGRISLDTVGVKALDDSTLEVTLASPISYFLELAASPAFFPVCSTIDDEGADFVGNGPFRLAQWKDGEYIEVVRNPTYWDSNSVTLAKIVVMMVDGETEAEMFANDELDWIGNGFASLPLQAFYNLVEDEEVSTPASMAMYWIRFNDEKAPFNNEKLLKAFSQVINRKLVLDDVVEQGVTRRTEDVDFVVAQQLFKEVRKEVDLSSLSVMYQPGIRNHKIAQEIQRQLKDAFDVDITTEEFNPLAYDKKVQAGDFAIATGFWPVDVVGNGEGKISQPFLVDDMSIVPVYYYTVSHAKKGYVHNLAESDEGSPDFKWTSVE
jgi:oligopeptide transport system substrate-binding protein